MTKITSLFVLILIGLSSTYSQAQVWENLNVPTDLVGSIVNEFDGRIFVSSHNTAETGKAMYYRDIGDTAWTMSTIQNEMKVILKIGDLLYASVDQEGVLTSADNGLTWVNITDSFPFDVLAVNVIEEVDGVLYISSLSDEMYRSADNGATWSSVTAGFDDNEQGLNVIGISKTPDGLFAYTFYGLAKSIDNGLNWYSVFDSDDPLVMNGVVYVDGNYFSNEYYSGVYSSNDEGESWSVSYPSFFWNSNSIKLVNNTVFVGAQNKLIYTTDIGTTWIEATPASTSDLSFHSAMNYFNDEFYVSILGTGVYKTSDFNSLGFNDAQFNSTSVFISPNPAKDYFSITSTTSLDTLKSVAIYNLLGQKVKDIALNELDVINIEALAEGSYLVRLETITGDITALKLVK